MFKTPILFLIFNRPDTTQQVFERIREIKPVKLYVAADGARKSKQGEEEVCRQVRNIATKIDWECELKTLFRDENLGCKIAVSEAITWFFDQEEQGIILEDDCLPDHSFFPFCEELLDRYKDDERVGHISGNCFLPGIIRNDISYDFCSFSHIWGWASWRRVWKNYDVKFSYWNENKHNKEMTNNIFNSPRERIYFSSFISDTLKNKINTWDVQYLFMLRVQNQLSIYPSVNLVTNIGLFSSDATHTVAKQTSKLYVKSQVINSPLKHPKYVFRNKKLDDRISKRNFFSWKRLLRYLLNDY